jgi:hypothetical protein
MILVEKPEGRPRHKLDDNIKIDFGRKIMGCCGLCCSGSLEGTMEDFCENVSESLGCVVGLDIPEYQSKWLLLKKCS